MPQGQERVVEETAPFTAATLRFLRALKRNNDRNWFNAHREDYEAHVKTPMAAAIERLGVEFQQFAPDLMADPKRSLYRIWRDTRFSADKRPLKTNVAAVFPHRRGTRHTSAGLYFEISPAWVFAGGGLYMPEPPALQRIRAHIAGDPRRFGRLVPRGFASDHPAAEYLKYKQFLGFREWPPELMTSPRFWPELVGTFRAVAPLVAYLNDAMGVGERKP
jgi:uncharacterized protein (DUF2461 family)